MRLPMVVSMERPLRELARRPAPSAREHEPSTLSVRALPHPSKNRGSLRSVARDAPRFALPDSLAGHRLLARPRDDLTALRPVRQVRIETVDVARRGRAVVRHVAILGALGEDRGPRD